MKSISVFLNQEELLFVENKIIQDSEGGIYNSSFFIKDERKYLISRVEKHKEYDRAIRHTQHKPVVFELEDDFTIKNHTDYSFVYDGSIEERINELGVQLEGYQKYRIEDYRTFTWKGELWCNHNLNLGITRPVISKINLEKNQLEHHKIKVVRILNGIEKNWLFFEHNSKLKFIYSFNPFVIMSSDDGYEFKRESYNKLLLDKKINWSGSTNPVLFDENNYMFFVHYRDENKVYCHHLVLIDKQTLIPHTISENPVFKDDNNKGVKKNVLYLMSHTKINDEDWIFSFGVGDLHSRIVRIKHSDILQQLKI